MRNLYLDEITDKISEYSSDINISDRKHLVVKIDQFLNFLLNQPISKRILERIEEDFSDLQQELIQIESLRERRLRKLLKEKLTTREQQGAFAFFEIYKKFLFERKSDEHYIDLGNIWYNTSPTGYDGWQQNFNTYFFEPFTELIGWYLYESKVQKDKDYYSREERILFEDKIETTLNNDTLYLYTGQEIIFNELQEIRTLVSGLNQKNLYELIKGKFIDMVISGVISKNIALTLIKDLTGLEVNF